MSFQWPWISRRAYDLVVDQLQQTAAERDEYRRRGDMLYDQTILRFGYEPATPSIRTQLREEQTQYEADITIDDPTTGMLDEEIEKTVDAAIAAVTTQKPS